VKQGHIEYYFSTFGMKTMELIALATQTALNVSSSGFTCAYSRPNKKFTISRATVFSLLFGSGASVATANSAALLGFSPDDKTGAAGYTSDYPIEEGHFLLTSSANFRLLWRSGPNGWLLRDPMLTAHSPLGLLPYDDTALACNVYGAVSKGERQADLATAVARYISATATGAARRELLIEGRAIYDTDTAIEVRNRVAGLMSQPRVTVSGLVDDAIGLERGEVVEFNFDAFCPYPDPDQNGSWVNKGLIVTEVVQHLGPDNCGTEFTAVAALES